VSDTDPQWTRRPWREGPAPDAPPDGWLSLSDDELLFKIEALAPSHGDDSSLLRIVRSDRHFFIRQEAAKKVTQPELLKDYSGDRHIGQILVRTMNRREDVVYLEKLIRESRHIEVRKAAAAQLVLLKRRF
jgi:hypothetical protein